MYFDVVNKYLRLVRALEIPEFLHNINYVAKNIHIFEIFITLRHIEHSGAQSIIESFALYVNKN